MKNTSVAPARGAQTSRTAGRLSLGAFTLAFAALAISPPPAQAVPAAEAAAAARVFPHPERIRYDRHNFTIHGKDVFLYSGAFHYFRCPKPLWRDRFQTIKDAGFNCVETYVPWNVHEREMPSGLDDFSKVDLTDFKDWMKMAEEFGFYMIIRPGPYICAEWDTGGFPQWLLTKKPADWKGLWLRSDEPTFLAWSQHWIEAVTPLVVPHQVTRKAPGQAGVIMFQIENEYDYLGNAGNAYSDAVKIRHLKALAEASLAGGIDVPLMTCWTKQVRGSDDPVLRPIFDSCNFYPRWKVTEELGKKMPALRAEQPDAPLMITELQAGWFSDIGGKLSEEQPGVNAPQIQNLTLYAIQQGATVLNYYMLFGGTNFEEWGGRNMTTSYDYNAPIREWGGVGERYQRVRAIGAMLREHGERLLKAETVACEVEASEKDVEVAIRRAGDGSRYLFVRTSDHERERAGKIRVKEMDTTSGSEIVFDYQLEPFGSKVFYLPPGVTDAAQGEWLPAPAPAIERPAKLPTGASIVSTRRRADPGPSRWQPMPQGRGLADVGIYDSGFLFYRPTAADKHDGPHLLVEFPVGDQVVAQVGQHLAPRTLGEKGKSTFAVGEAGPLTLLYENRGHAHIARDFEFASGISAARFVSGDQAAAPSAQASSADAMPSPLSLEFGRPAGLDEQWWKPEFNDDGWDTVSFDAANASSTPAALTWYRMEFSLPAVERGVWVPWRLRLHATGNGFLYLNGHSLGRYWEAGPQHDFFLPECWLKFGNGQTNQLTLSLRPLDKGAEIQSAVVEPYAEFAEKR